MKRNKNKPKFINRFVSAVLSATLLVTGVPFPVMSGKFHFKRIQLIKEQTVMAEDTEPEGITEDLFNQSSPTSPITINTPDDFKKFSWWYNKYGDSNSMSYITIAITAASTYNGMNFIDLHEGFTSIGTENRPFKGKIMITNASLDNFFLFKPFFGVVDQATQITNEDNTVRNMKFLCSMGYTGDSYAMPTPHAVFANKIVNIAIPKNKIKVDNSGKI